MLIDIDDIVTKSEIAAALGVGPSAVSNWKRRHDDFPKPIKTWGGNNQAGPSELYDMKEVAAWFDLHVRGEMSRERIDAEINRLNKLKESLERGDNKCGKHKC